MGSVVLLYGCSGKDGNGPSGTTPKTTLTPAGSMVTEVFHPNSFSATVTNQNNPYDITFFVNGEAVHSGSNNYIHTMNVSGVIDTVYAEAKDRKSGLIGKSPNAFVTSVNTPATISATPEKQQIEVRQSITYTVSVQDPSGMQKVEFDVDNDGVVEDVKNYGNLINPIQYDVILTPNQIGQVTGSIEVTDREGDISTYTIPEVNVMAAIPPTVSETNLSNDFGYQNDITVKFTEDVQNYDNGFRLIDRATGAEVGFTLSYTDMTATLNPTQDLIPGRQYTLEILIDITDNDGNQFDGDSSQIGAQSGLIDLVVEGYFTSESIDLSKDEDQTNLIDLSKYFNIPNYAGNVDFDANTSQTKIQVNLIPNSTQIQIQPDLNCNGFSAIIVKAKNTDTNEELSNGPQKLDRSLGEISVVF